MIVKRIVANFAAADVSRARQFYSDVLGLTVAMDLGWIATFESPSRMAPRLASQKAVPAHQCLTYRSKSMIWMKRCGGCGSAAWAFGSVRPGNQLVRR